MGKGLVVAIRLARSRKQRLPYPQSEAGEAHALIAPSMGVTATLSSDTGPLSLHTEHCYDSESTTTGRGESAGIKRSERVQQ